MLVQSSKRHSLSACESACAHASCTNYQLPLVISCSIGKLSGLVRWFGEDRSRLFDTGTCNP